MFIKITPLIILFAQQSLYTGQWSWTAKKQEMCMWRGLVYAVSGNGKSKGYPVTDHEAPELD